MTDVLLLLILLAQVASLVLAHYWPVAAKPREAALPVSVPPGEVQLLYRDGGQWVHHSTRPEGHKDIVEALATPGMAVSRGGVIEEGVQ